MTATAYTLSITPRDALLQLMVFAYDGCLISHLYRRFWSSGGTDSPASAACYRRIAQLVAGGWLQATRLPSLTGTGAGYQFITLGPRGRQLVAEHLGLPRSELRRLREVETPFALAHHSAICDFRVALEMACEQTGLARLDEWTSERELRQPPIVRVTDPRPSGPGFSPATIPLIPDGTFRLRFPDGTAASFRLEMDMGTIPRKRLSQRLRGQLVHASTDERPVLYVVPNERRLRDITAWATEEANALGADPTIFWVATFDRIRPAAILSPIWQVVGGPSMALVPATSSGLASGRLHFISPPTASSDGGHV
jgi:hypothetical protein